MSDIHWNDDGWPCHVSHEVVVGNVGNGDQLLRATERVPYTRSEVCALLEISFFGHPKRISELVQYVEPGEIARDFFTDAAASMELLCAIMQVIPDIRCIEKGQIEGASTSENLPILMRAVAVAGLRVVKEKSMSNDELLRRAYILGWERAVDDFAIWRDGEQRIGCMERKKSEVIAKGPNLGRLKFDLERVRVVQEKEAQS